MTEQRQKKMGKNHSMKLVFKHYTSYPMSRGTLRCGETTAYRVHTS